MNSGYFHRAELLVGSTTHKAISESRVILFGVGGVGSWCAEGLIRSGLTQLTIVDPDTVCTTNINRQRQATSHTVGQVKVEALKDELLKINPDAHIEALQQVYTPETSDSFKLTNYDYVVDAIDSMKNKTNLIETALKLKVKLYSSMGAALKIDPTKIKADSIWKTEGCPLAREVRRYLRKKIFQKNLPVYLVASVLAVGVEKSTATAVSVAVPKKAAKQHSRYTTLMRQKTP